MLNPKYLLLRRFAVLALASVLPLCAGPEWAAAKFITLHSFTWPTDGAGPAAGVIRDSSGNLFGTTESGGGTGCSGAGCGIVFKIAPDGTETILHSFKGRSRDGSTPYGGLIEDPSGNLYGTTWRGGSTKCGSGCGTVFKIAPNGKESILYAFQGGKDGSLPMDSLFEDSAGNFYGTTDYGGTYNYGTVFKLASDGTETILYSFAGSSDGGYPWANVIADESGNLYGTTVNGGIRGNGVVFKVTPDGSESVLYTFTGGTDGGNSFAGLIMDKKGNLYGTASFGGTWGWGNVFKLAPNGTETVLYSFSGGTDGGQPYSSGVIKDGKGDLYGTTSVGGTFGNGVIFKLDSSGVETVLHAFKDKNGGNVEPGVIRDQSGNLYGTTILGGESRDGTVFELTR